MARMPVLLLLVPLLARLRLGCPGRGLSRLARVVTAGPARFSPVPVWALAAPEALRRLQRNVP